jgi:hypothetical protein
VQNIFFSFTALKTVFLLPLSLPLPFPFPSYALLTCMMRCDGVSLPVVSLSTIVSAALREYDMLPSSNLHKNRTEQSRKAELLSCHKMNTHSPSCQFILSYLILSYLIPFHIISYHIISCHVMSCHIMSCHIMSCNLMSSHLMSFHFISSYLSSSHLVSLISHVIQLNATHECIE